MRASRTTPVLVGLPPAGRTGTMGVVEKLNASCPDKVSYYCSKADTIADDNDRQKVRHPPLRNPYNVSMVL